MFKTLILRNAKRSAIDYLIYIGTMTIISALMFALHGMLFSKDMRTLYDGMVAFAGLLGLASFFIIGIVVWLIGYIVNFMMEKRSKEFGTYLLLGMSKKEIIRIFRRENYLLGLLSIVLGIIPGYLFQLLFTNIFYSALETDYRITPDLNGWYLLLTVGILGLAYLWAMRKVKRKMKKMTIREYISLDQKNEQIINEKSSLKGILFFLAMAYILFFNWMILTSSMTLISGSIYSLVLIIAIYLLYVGLAGFFVGFIQRKSRLIYKKDTIFVLRQLSSKIKTMRFTMGTLTVLFTVSLLSWMVVMMFTDLQQNLAKEELPFDVALFNAEPNYAFEEQLAIIEEDAEINDRYIYNIYQNGTKTMNDYLYANVDSTRVREVDGYWTYGAYFGEDTYMKLSDYNHLRQMLGYEPVQVADGNYLLQGKKRLAQQWEQVASDVSITVGDRTLTQQAVKMDGFSQSGINGADYLIVVSDETAAQLTPYYGLMVADLAGKAPVDLQQRLDDIDDSYIESENLYIMEYGNGSNQFFPVGGAVMVKDTIQKSSNFASATLCFVMAYIGIVFLCAALTILAVQQLSDSTKYKKRYDILRQLGLNKKETERAVLKQLSVYYFCPYIISILLSIFIGLFAGERFAQFSVAKGSPVQFYLLALALFSVIYFAYFIITYVGFIRNIEKH